MQNDGLNPDTTPVSAPDPTPIRAYTLDSDGQLRPFDSQLLLLSFSGGRWLELSWMAPHPSDPFPTALHIHGGRYEGVDEAEMMASNSVLAVIPFAANQVTIHPYRPAADPKVATRRDPDPD